MHFYFTEGSVVDLATIQSPAARQQNIETKLPRTLTRQSCARCPRKLQISIRGDYANAVRRDNSPDPGIRPNTSLLQSLSGVGELRVESAAKSWQDEGQF